jgi:RNA polymerase sigma-70 factor (ECF subfamily)
MSAQSDSDPGFLTTRWSLVAALDQNAREGGRAGPHPLDDGASTRQRLLELCLRYWYPVYVYLRRSGHPPAAAQALAAGFFDALLQRRGSGASRGRDGRFRTFLLGELHRFLAARNDDTVTAPRDPGVPIPALAQLEARRQREGDAGGSPELALQRGFALEVIARAMQHIEDEAREAGRLPMFAALQPYLANDPVPGDYADIALRLDVSPLFLSLALKRLRERFRELVDDELAQTVASANALEIERRTLHAALQSAA